MGRATQHHQTARRSRARTNQSTNPGARGIEQCIATLTTTDYRWCSISTIVIGSPASAAPAVFRHAYASDSVRGLLLFVGSYLAVWALIGVALYPVYSLYRPHGSVTAGALVFAAGVYEFTPLKQHFRRRCKVDKSLRSGVEFGLYCVGSSIGLMLVQVALGFMSVTWMSVVGVLMLAQKVLPAKA